MASIAYLLSCRAKAQAAGDRGQVRAINADLARLGYADTAPRPEAPEAPEPTEAPVEPGMVERRPYGAPEQRPAAGARRRRPPG